MYKRLRRQSQRHLQGEQDGADARDGVSLPACQAIQGPAQVGRRERGAGGGGGGAALFGDLGERAKVDLFSGLLRDWLRRGARSPSSGALAMSTSCTPGTGLEERTPSKLPRLRMASRCSLERPEASTTRAPTAPSMRAIVITAGTRTDRPTWRGSTKPHQGSFTT